MTSLSRRKWSDWLGLGSQGSAVGAELEPLRSSTPNVLDDEHYGSRLDDPGILEETTDDQSISSRRRSSVEEFFIRSDLPKEVQLLRLENFGIPACYFVVGTMQGMFRPLLNVYPLNLGASEAQQTTLSQITTLPATFKILYGFLSDNVLIAGYRRKPYMLLGWLIASGVMASLILYSDLTMSYNENDEPLPPPDAPSVQRLSASFFIFGCGMWFADVMADSLVAQKARLEPESVRGNLQATCYASRFFGQMVSAVASTYMYSHQGPWSIVIVLMTAPLFMIPLIYLLEEERDFPCKRTMDQVHEIWRTVCTRSVWQPMGYLYVFNLLQVSNAAWRQYLKTVLQFTEAQLNSLLIAAYFLLYAGTMVYKYCFINTSWRRLYQVSILINALLSGLQLMLIRGHTFGLDPFFFALGDDAFAEFIVGIQFLPTAILMVALCPPGSEGASYAMFTTVWNSAMMTSPAISSMLLGIWDVSEAALKAGYLDGLFNLSLLTTVIQTSPILLLHLLPHGRKELEALSETAISGSPIGGGIFLFIVFGSMAYTFATSLQNILHPDWAGAS